MRTTETWLATATAVLLALALGACVPEQAERFAAPLDPPPGAVLCENLQERSSEQLVGPSGSAVQVRGHRLSIPAGAVQQDVAFTLTELAAPYIAIRAVPSGTHFERPATLRISYERCAEAPGEDFVVYRRQGNGWEPVQERVRVLQEERAVEVQIEHLSVYALAAG